MSAAADRLLTLAQAAERSECEVKTLRRAIAAGDLTEWQTVPTVVIPPKEPA